MLQTSCYSTCEPTLGALCPVLRPQEPERRCCTGMSLAEGPWDSQGWDHTTNKEGLKSLFGLSKEVVEGSKYYLRLPDARWVTEKMGHTLFVGAEQKDKGQQPQVVVQEIKSK